MIHDIIKLMYKRDHVHAKATQNNDSKLWQDYRNLRNKVTCIIKGLKRMSISMIFIHSAEMTPKMWSEIKRLEPGKNKHILLVTFLRMISITILSILATKWTPNSKILMKIFLERLKKYS